MANDYFRFRRFTVHQGMTAMKVGTDGTLLGAWARGGRRILDVGTGTGLIALMMAQRFPAASVVGIDVDACAVSQAQSNVVSSPFADVTICQADVRRFTSSVPFDAVVCNPPYFVGALPSPDARRTLARHAVSLTYGELMNAVLRLLSDDGEFSVVVPFDCRSLMESEAALAGLHKVRQCAVTTTPRKPPRRFLLAFAKHYGTPELTEGTLLAANGERSKWYEALTADFYL